MSLTPDSILGIRLASAFYIYYMIYVFTTRYSIAHPLTYFESEIWHHPIGTFDEPMSMVCPFGKMIFHWIIGWWILYALTTYQQQTQYFDLNLPDLRFTHRIILILLFVGSLLNFNVTLYLLPIYLIEYYLLTV